MSMREVELNWSKIVAVWWLITWRAMAGGMLMGGAFGMIIGVIGGLAGVEPTSLRSISTIGGLFCGLIWGLIAVRMALRKHYSGFRLALVEA